MGKMIFGNGNSKVETKVEPEAVQPLEIIKEVFIDRPVETIVEKIVEKHVEVPVEVIKEIIKEVTVEKIVEVEKIKAVEVKVVDDKLTEELKKCVVENEAIMLLNKSYFKSIQDLMNITKKNEEKMDLYNKIYIVSFICIIAYLLFK